MNLLTNMPTTYLTKEEFKQKRKEWKVPSEAIALIERKKGDTENTIYKIEEK